MCHGKSEVCHCLKVHNKSKSWLSNESLRSHCSFEPLSGWFILKPLNQTDEQIQNNFFNLQYLWYWLCNGNSRACKSISYVSRGVWMKTLEMFLEDVSNHSGSQLHQDVWTAKLFFFFVPIVQCRRRVLLPCAPHYIFLAVGGKDRARGKAIYKSILCQLYCQSLCSFTADKFLSSSIMIVVWGFTLRWLWYWWSGVLSLWSHFNEQIWLSL